MVSEEINLAHVMEAAGLDVVETIGASWVVIDPLEEFWAGTTPHPYRAGEWGPRAADEMLADIINIKR